MATSIAATSSDVASASAKAIAAATSTKPRPSPLPTPHSATFPSALQTPAPTPGFLQAERNQANMKTPITPPSAYLDFLRNFDANGLRTPLATSKSANFSFSAGARSPYPWPKQPSSARPPPLSAQDARFKDPSRAMRAPTPPTSSGASAVVLNNSTNGSIRRASHGDEPASATDTSRATSLPSHSKPLQPQRRPSLIIPESPSQPSFSVTSATNMSPPSAHVSRARSPATANAARDYYMHISPDGTTPRSASAPTLGKHTYTVRHVITRTVTYTRPAGSSAMTPGPTAGTLAPTSRPTSSSSPRSRERTPKGDVMKLDTILNSTTDEADPGQKRKPEVKAEEDEQQQDASRSTVSPIEQLVDAQQPSSHSPSRPLIGEVPFGKRRRVE